MEGDDWNAVEASTRISKSDNKKKMIRYIICNSSLSCACELCVVLVEC